MRLLCTISSDIDLTSLFRAFQAEGIVYEYEEIVSEKTCRIWIISEEHVERAASIWRHTHFTPHNPEALPSIQPRATTRLRAPWTIALLMICALLTIYDVVATKPPNPRIPSILPGPGVSPLGQKLLFDFPEYFVLREEVVSSTTPQFSTPGILHRMETIPLWMGLYPMVLPRSNLPQLNLSAAAFGKNIREGEIWRIWTPILLHVDFLHFFFNATWIWVLGSLIETKLGSWRYLVLLLMIAILSNVAQYCMTGPFFMGLSGIVCGLAAFVWVRQKRAPWEGYRVAPFVLLFLFFFIGGMVLLEWISLSLTLWKGFSLPITIANTAHVTGALAGGLLALPLRLLQPRNRI